MVGYPAIISNGQAHLFQEVSKGGSNPAQRKGTLLDQKTKQGMPAVRSTFKLRV